MKYDNRGLLTALVLVALALIGGTLFGPGGMGSLRQRFAAGEASQVEYKKIRQALEW